MHLPEHPSDSSAIVLRQTPGWPQTNRYPELRELAERQLGVVSREQLRALGVSAHRVEHEIGMGRWTLPAPNVVALQNAPLVRSQRLWLGVLHAGASGVISHATACESGGLRWTLDATIHVLTEKGNLVLPLEGFRFRQTRRPYREWLHPSSDPPRLQIEHAALLAAERDRYLRRAIGLLAAVVQQRLSTAERLTECALQIRKLRNGRQFNLALQDIAGGAQSFAEIDIGRLCVEADLRPPDRQRIRHDKTGRRRYLDCEWVLPDGTIVVLEIDGSFHLRTEHWWNDMKRERSVVVSGRRVLRCSSIEIRLDPSDVLEDLVSVGVPRFVCDRSA